VNLYCLTAQQAFDHVAEDQSTENARERFGKVEVTALQNVLCLLPNPSHAANKL